MAHNCFLLKDMKKLIFIRHAKAEEQAYGISDFERSLTVKGKFVSHNMARRYKTIEKSPGTFISSPAFRALETAFIFAKELDIEYDKLILDNNIYYKMNLNSLSKILSRVNESTNSVTLFGHNPSFSEISDSLCRKGCNYMTKCSIVCISFNTCTWSDIKRNIGKLEYFLEPEK